MAHHKAPKSSDTKSKVVKGIMALAIVSCLIVTGLAIGLTSLAANLTKNNPVLATAAADITSGFAKKRLIFGSKGTDPGMFTDARSVAVDGKGNILVGDYQDGRVQTFDYAGKYLSSFTIGEGSTSVDALQVGPDRKIYVAHNGILSTYDSTGKKIGIVEGAQGTDAITFGPDGSLYILTGEDVIKRFDTHQKLTLTIPHAFSSQTGSGESTQYIAVDKLGNIYIVGDLKCMVIKYAPDGKFLTKFGGRAKKSGPAIPGTLFTPSGIVVDSYNRVFVSDWNTDVEVFQSNGKPIRSIDAVTLGFTSLVYGMNIDKNGIIYLALGDKIMELEIEAAVQQ